MLCYDTLMNSISVISVISVISWRSVLLVEETGVPEKTTTPTCRKALTN